MRLKWEKEESGRLPGWGWVDWKVAVSSSVARAALTAKAKHFTFNLHFSWCALDSKWWCCPQNAIANAPAVERTGASSKLLLILNQCFGDSWKLATWSVAAVRERRCLKQPCRSCWLGALCSWVLTAREEGDYASSGNEEWDLVTLSLYLLRVGVQLFLLFWVSYSRVSQLDPPTPFLSDIWSH